MKNIIKDIYSLEEEKKLLIKNGGSSSEVSKYDVRLNDLILIVKDFLSIDMRLVGPYLAAIKSIINNDCYEYKEIKEKDMITYIIKNVDEKIILAQEKVIENNYKVQVYSFSKEGNTLILRLTGLNEQPAIKEFVDELITFQINHKIYDESLSEFFYLYVQDSNELRKVRKNSNI